MKSDLFKLIVSRGMSIFTSDGGKNWTVYGPITGTIPGGIRYRCSEEDVPRRKLRAIVKKLAGG